MTLIAALFFVFSVLLEKYMSYNLASSTMEKSLAIVVNLNFQTNLKVELQHVTGHGLLLLLKN